MNLSINKDSKLDYVVITDSFATIKFIDGLRIELSAAQLDGIINLAEDFKRWNKAQANA